MPIPTSEAQVTSAIDEQTADSESQTEMETEQPVVAMELEVDGGAQQEQESEGAESCGHELPCSDKYDSDGPRGQNAASSHVDEGTLSLSEPGMTMYVYIHKQNHVDRTTLTYMMGVCSCIILLLYCTYL